MALVTRLSRLFQADFHAVLDRIEEPDLQLRQAVREMQLALDQDRQRLKLLQHESTQLDKSISEADTSLRQFDEELDICLAAKKDDLARDLIRRKLAAEKHSQNLRNQAASIDGQIETLSRQLDDQEQQLVSMKQKLELLVTNGEQHSASSVIHGNSIRREEIEIALLREKERRAKA